MAGATRRRAVKPIEDGRGAGYDDELWLRVTAVQRFWGRGS